MSTTDIISEFPDPWTESSDWTGDQRRHSDVDAMRRRFGIPEWDADGFEYNVLPDLLEHTYDGEGSSGGTDCFIRGKPGKGKSTLLNYWVIRLIEINEEKVFWRGSSSRSEWLPLAPWATLWLPHGMQITAKLESRDPREADQALEVAELEQIVRQVRFYRDPRDLLDRADRGQLHIIYPDPQMRGCQAALEESAERSYETPAGRETLFHPEDPDHHWWIGFNLERVENGPHDFSTWICDEIGDILPQDARKDAFGSYQKVMLTRDSMVDFRKFGHTIMGAGHSSKDLHAVIRRKLRWRVQMPGQANPTSASQVVGFESIPMHSDMTSRMSIGNALVFTESRFSKFAWKDVATPTSHKLKISIRKQ